jgi:1-deoxy-D-xylulose 5-phosphate reductoisomerase
MEIPNSAVHHPDYSMMGKISSARSTVLNKCMLHCGYHLALIARLFFVALHHVLKIH